MTPAKTPAKSSKSPATKAPESATALLIVSDTVRHNAEGRMADILANIGLHQETINKADEKLLDEQKRYRRMFPASPGVKSLFGGADVPDLIGSTDAYRKAWQGVKAAAQTKLSEMLQAEGMSRKTADLTAKTQLETERKSLSRDYRIDLEKAVREEFDSPVQRAVFMLSHGFKYNSTVPEDTACIAWKDSKVERDDETGAVTLVVPDHIVDMKAGTVKAIEKKTTAGNQDGKGDNDKRTDTQKAIQDLTNRLAKRDQLGTVESIRGLINGLIGLVAPLESTDLATRSRAIVDLERSLVRLGAHWQVTKTSLTAARKLADEGAPKEEPKEEVKSTS